MFATVINYDMFRNIVIDYIWKQKGYQMKYVFTIHQCKEYGSGLK